SRKAAMLSVKRQRAEHRQYANDQHPRVNSDITGLQSRSYPAEATSKCRAPINEEAVDQPVVDKSPKEISRHCVSRRDNGPVETFVDVVLVSDHSREAGLRHCFDSPWHASRLETQPCEENSGDRNYHGCADEHLLGVRRRVRAAADNLRGGIAHYWIEPVTEKLTRPKRNEIGRHLRQIQPTAENR